MLSHQPTHCAMNPDMTFHWLLGAALGLSTAFAVPRVEQGWDKPSTLSTENFTLVAWYCEGDRCRSKSRRLVTPVRFDQATWQGGVADLDHPATSWNVVLNCAVVRRRLARCSIQDDTVSTKQGIAIAAKLVKKLRIIRYVFDSPIKKRALVIIEYYSGMCPMCPNTPPPRTRGDQLQTR